MRGAVSLLAAVALLTGCESGAEHSTQDLFDEHDIALHDGSTVTCLTYDRALDCDWGGAR